MRSGWPAVGRMLCVRGGSPALSPEHVNVGNLWNKATCEHVVGISA